MGSFCILLTLCVAGLKRLSRLSNSVRKTLCKFHDARSPRFRVLETPEETKIKHRNYLLLHYYVSVHWCKARYCTLFGNGLKYTEKNKISLYRNTYFRRRVQIAHVWTSNHTWNKKKKKVNENAKNNSKYIVVTEFSVPNQGKSGSVTRDKNPKNNHESITHSNCLILFMEELIQRYIK